MAFKIADRVKETTTTTGTGDLTLAGAATGFRTFTSQLATNDRCFYSMQHQTAAEWEVGLGKLTGATTLVREQVLSSSNSGALVALSSGTKDVFIAPLAVQLGAVDALVFGDGSDGDLSGAIGTVTLSRDTYYKTVGPITSGTLITNGFKVFVSEVLDLTGMPANTIVPMSQSGSNGAAGAAGGTGGSGGSQMLAGTLGASFPGTAGGAGGTGAGSQATAPTASTAGLDEGGASGTSGAGGVGNTGGSSAAGAARAGAGIAATVHLVRRHDTLCARGISLLQGGMGGAGGGGGGGDGTSGAGGGGGGAGGGTIWICARIVKRDGTTTASAIAAIGGTGGLGGTATAGVRGGGGGGSGGGGGWVYFAYGAVVGSSATNCFDASGGTGGVGGTGIGSGASGGDSGGGGSGGRITLNNLGTATVTETTGSAGTSGNAHSGLTGGTPGGAGNTFRASL